MEKEKRIIYADDLREEIASLQVTVTGLRDGKGVLREYMEQYRASVLRIIDEQPTVEASEPPRSVIEPRVPELEMQKKVQYLLEWGFITPNEAHDLLGLPPV